MALAHNQVCVCVARGNRGQEQAGMDEPHKLHSSIHPFHH